MRNYNYNDIKLINFIINLDTKKKKKKTSINKKNK